MAVISFRICSLSVNSLSSIFYNRFIFFCLFLSGFLVGLGDEFNGYFVVLLGLLLRFGNLLSFWFGSFNIFWFFFVVFNYSFCGSLWLSLLIFLSLCLCSWFSFGLLLRFLFNFFFGLLCVNSFLGWLFFGDSWLFVIFSKLYSLSLVFLSLSESCDVA